MSLAPNFWPRQLSWGNYSWSRIRRPASPHQRRGIRLPASLRRQCQSFSGDWFRVCQTCVGYFHVWCAAMCIVHCDGCRPSHQCEAGHLQQEAWTIPRGVDLQYEVDWQEEAAMIPQGGGNADVQEEAETEEVSAAQREGQRCGMCQQLRAQSGRLTVTCSRCHVWRLVPPLRAEVVQCLCRGWECDGLLGSGYISPLGSGVVGFMGIVLDAGQVGVTGLFPGDGACRGACILASKGGRDVSAVVGRALHGVGIRCRRPTQGAAGSQCRGRSASCAARRWWW